MDARPIRDELGTRERIVHLERRVNLDPFVEHDIVRLTFP